MFEIGERKDMGLLIVSIIVASATSTSVYITSESLMLAFIAYSAAGTIALFSAIIADGLVNEDLID